jgi:hypothetical protein
VQGSKYPLNELYLALVLSLIVQRSKKLRVLPQGFKIFALFDLVFGIKLKTKPYCLVSDGMPMVSNTFLVGDVVGSIPAPAIQNIGY